MSWQVASLALIAIVLVGGALWYERSQPPARLVALVAALAALAVAGRIALAPIPNVVATTDVALLTGYSLGGAPGFAVGALAGLVSNIWLGQGPWTPWQMAGWGLVGLGGAALARLTLHRAGRGVLAIAAGLAGLLYGALLDLSVMVNFGGEQSLDRYLALSARGIPFNIAHALGNVALIWVAGPAVVRMLERYRVRSSFVWHDERPRTPQTPRSTGALGTLTVVVALLALLPAAALAGPASKATDWLERQQNADGGWGFAPGSESSPGITRSVILGLEAAGINPRDLDPDPVAYLRERAGQIKSATDIERTILALEAAGLSSRAFAGRDLVAELVEEREPGGLWKGGTNPTAFGILALISADERSLVGKSVSWLIKARNGDGGWGFNRGVSSDPDSTGAALQALVADGGHSSVVRDGARYLRRVQRGDGGFPAQPGLVSNSQSTALAIHGLVAAGVDPSTVETRSASPIDFLRRRQAGDGHVAYSRQSDQTPVWVTAQAVMALEEKALPLAAVEAGRATPRRSSRHGKRLSPGSVSSGGEIGEGRKGVPRNPGGPRQGERDPKGDSGDEKPGRKASERSNDPRADRVVTVAKPGVTDLPAAGPQDDSEDDSGLSTVVIALLAAGAVALIAAGTWAYRRFL